MESTVLEQALSEVEFCENNDSWGYPFRVAGCLRRLFRELLAPNNENPTWKIVHTAIVDICTSFPVEIESEDYGFDTEELI